MDRSIKYCSCCENPASICESCYEELEERLEHKIDELEDELKWARRSWLTRLSDWLWGFYK